MAAAYNAISTDQLGRDLMMRSVASFTANIKPLRDAKRIVIAVSGGRDSMALAVLAAQYAREHAVQILALSVDHGLREASAREAEQTAQWCRGLGLPHKILTWQGEKPDTGLQAAARDARYKLLIGEAMAFGADVLVTGHTRDDQAETVYMRRQRSEGRGLSAMRDAQRVALAATEPIWLVRPLLDISRQETTQIVRQAGQDFIDDPSNDDMSFERVRARQILASDDGRQRDELLALALQTRTKNRRQYEDEESLFTKLNGQLHDWGGASLDVLAPGDEERAGIGDLLARLVRGVGASAYRPSEDAAGRLLQALIAGKGFTLGGVAVERYRGRVWMFREPAAILGRHGVEPLTNVELPADSTVLWDQRFIITAKDVSDAYITPAGAFDLEKEPADRSAARDGPSPALPKGAYLSVPCVAARGVGASCGPIASPLAILNPSRDAKPLNDATNALPMNRSGIAFRALNRERFAEDVLRFS